MEIGEEARLLCGSVICQTIPQGAIPCRYSVALSSASCITRVVLPNTLPSTYALQYQRSKHYYRNTTQESHHAHTKPINQQRYHHEDQRLVRNPQRRWQDHTTPCVGHVLQTRAQAHEEARRQRWYQLRLVRIHNLCIGSCEVVLRVRLHGSLQRIVENPLLYPILPIVYLLRPPARYPFATSTLRYKARAEIIPIYIHIKTKTFIYMSDLLCRSVGNFTYLLSLIILYFSYIFRYDACLMRVSYGLQGVTMTGTIPLKGGHSRKNLPEMGEVLPKQGEM